VNKEMRVFLSRWVVADGRTILAIGAGRRQDGSRRFFHVGFDGGDVDGPVAAAIREDGRGNDVYLALARYGAATDAKGQPRRTGDNAFGCASFQVDADVKEGGYQSVREAAEAVALAGTKAAAGSGSFHPALSAGDVRNAPGGTPAKGEAGELGTGRKVDLAVVSRECLIMADAVDSGGEKHAEPLWRDLLMLTLFGEEEDDRTAHAISCRHPGYSASETDAKLELVKRQRLDAIARDKSFGPPTCGRLDELWRGQFGDNPHCAACAHRGHIKSPAYAPNRTGIAQASEAGFSGQGFPAPGTPASELPASERMGAYWPDFVSGGMRQVVVDPKVGEKAVLVTEYHVRGPFLAKDEHGDLDLVAYWSLRDWPAGRGDDDLGHRVAMPVAHINDTRQFARVLGLHGIGLSDRHRQGVRDMYAAFTTQLRQFSAVRKLPKSMGWHDAPDLDPDRQGFVVGGKFWLADGTGIETSLGGNPVASAYEPRGTLARWLQAAATILTDPRPHVHAMVGISLGSILLPLVGMRGAVSSFVSPESGYGKTTMAWLAASIWGHPEKSTGALNDTFNATIHRAQFTACLPTIVDDTRPSQWEIVEMMLFRFTQGKEKLRLSGSAQLQEAGTFDGALILTGNAFISELIAQGRLGAAALARITEYQVPLIGTAHDASAVAAAMVTLKSNYGTFGVRYVQHVLANVDRIRTTLATLIDQLTTFAAVHPTDREARFQVATVAAAIVGAMEARRLGLPIDPVLARDLMVGKLKSGRTGRLAAATTPQGVSLLVEFLEDQADSKAVLTGSHVDFIGKRLPISYVVERAGKRLFVDARTFTDWLVKRRAPVRATFDDLAAHHHMNERLTVLARGVAAVGNVRRRVLIMPCLRSPLDTLV
jgi:hypothetical protein